jgi:hypothetical protein
MLYCTDCMREGEWGGGGVEGAGGWGGAEGGANNSSKIS